MYKMTNFTPSNTSIMPNKIPLTNLERLLRRVKSPLTRLQREIYRALIVPKWPKWQSLQPQKIYEKQSQVKHFFKFKLKTTISFD